MASSADVAYTDVHLGPWTDRSKSGVHGANITVTSTNGVILVAFIALFVQFSGQHLWGIAAFVWHQLRVSRRAKPKTALQYQQDACLRNNGSPAQVVYNLIIIAWSWRHARKAGTGWWRSATLPAVVPLAFIIFLTASGILSSAIVETSDVEILLEGNSCGVWKTPSLDDTLASDNAFMVENHRYTGALSEFSRIYARNCYNKTEKFNSPQCQAFTKRAIPYLSQTDETCPFSAETCVYPSKNLRMDTMELDSNKDLGINSPESIKFRKVTTCAPLKPDIYTTRTNRTGVTGFPEYHVEWNWGTLLYIDYDYIAEADSSDGMPFAGYSMITPRHFIQEPRLDFPDQSSFEPRAEFNRTDGDTWMLFLSAHDTVFSAACDDPWFSAHKEQKTKQNRSQYFPDYLMSPVGCVEQYSFCSGKKGENACTPLAGLLPAAANAKFDIGLNPTQAAIVDIVLNVIMSGSIFIAQPVYLLADEAKSEATQMPLPINQWVIELQDMHNRVLTGFQRAIVDYARGPGSAAAQEFIVVPNEESRTLCDLIRARTDGRFSNMNTYGVALTFTLGGIIILINLFLVDIMRWIKKRRGGYSQRLNSWDEDGLLQLHKKSILLEESPDAWNHLDKPVPTTKDCSPRSRTFHVDKITPSITRSNSSDITSPTSDEGKKVFDQDIETTMQAEEPPRRSSAEVLVSPLPVTSHRSGQT